MPDDVRMLLFSQFFSVLQIVGEDGPDMQNPKPLYNKLNMDICKNNQDYVGFSYLSIALLYTIYQHPLRPYS